MKTTIVEKGISYPGRLPRDTFKIVYEIFIKSKNETVLGKKCCRKK